MSRFRDDGDYDDENWALNYGRWQRNMRVAVTSKRGQKALRDLREALLSLPGHQLIESAVCTVGGADKRAPLMTDEQVRAYEAYEAEWRAAATPAADPDWPQRAARMERADREEDHDDLARIITDNGCEGVCAVGAYAWHQRVKAGMDPAEAFESLPTIAGAAGEAADTETAKLGEQAGLTYTLAWMLADLNDNTFRGYSPTQRWQELIRWIDDRLITGAAS